MKRSSWKLGLVFALAACSHPAPEHPVAISVPVESASAKPAPPPAEPAPARGPQSNGKESKVVARTLERVSKLRGVRAARTVPGVTLERDALVGRIKEKALREFPPDALRREGQVLQLLGFAPVTFDYLGETMKLLEAQLEGFYEPNDGTMYLAADLHGPEAQATLAHELVHALQDQNWDLKSRSSYRPGKGDETLALGCLAEGDATSSMLDYMLADKSKTALDVPDDAIGELMANGMNGASIRSVPHILRTSLVAPYIDGLAFVQGLRRRGGWPMVDRVWAQPPTTTEQVLHVDKWMQKEAAVTVRAPTASTLGSAFRLVDEDSLGELGFALAFEEWMDRNDARLVASGWGGDRSSVYANADEIAFAVRARYDDAAATGGRPDAFATRALGKIAPALRKRFGKPAVDAPDVVCFERKELGPLLFARRDRDVVMIAGPARAAAAGWASASTCTQARAWSGEILAMR